ncbi:MAG: hypothetical protein ACLFWB_08920 [Armatimonadota bacterium]
MWKSLGFADLPVKNPHWEVYDLPRIGTMAEVRTGPPDEQVVRNGLTYGWRDHANAADHVFETACVRREPCGRYDLFISADASNWLFFDGLGIGVVSFPT